MQLEPYIQKVIEAHPEFTESEIQELCEEFLTRYKAKTKEETKQKGIKKFLTKEFGVDFDVVGAPLVSAQDGQSETFAPFSSIPKQYFQASQTIKSAYILSIKWLHKQLGTTVLFDDAEVRIRTGDKIALVGKNGAGKSTLLKIIIGKEEYNLWDIELEKHVRIGFLSQDLFRHNRENIVADEMMQTLPQVTKTMERLREIESLIDQGHADAVQLLEE